jgi:intracellular multiplication protein IcmP
MSSQQKGDAEPGFVLFMLGAILFGILWLLWHSFKGPILELMRWLRYSELWIISFFTDKQDACLSWLRYVRFNDLAPPPQIIQWTQACFGPDILDQMAAEDSIQYYQLSATSMSAVERIITYYDRWVLIAGLGWTGVYFAFFSPRNKFKTRHTLETFIKVQAKMWPVIAPIVNFNPAKSSARRLGDTMPDKTPIFAEAFSPEEWVSWHRIAVTNGIPDREATRRAFLLQLGPRWQGIEGMPLHIRALFATFALKGAQKRDESDAMLGRLSLAWSPKNGLSIPSDLMSEIERALHDPKIGGAALEAASHHAYRTTAMLEVLRWARSQGGVLAPAQFLWLRGADRGLWYPLNNLGRRSFHSEGAGAMAHFMAEKNAKKPLPIPRIDTAIVTLNQYFASAGLPIPPREGDSAKTRT